MSGKLEKDQIFNRQVVAAFASGAVFAVGLALAGMTKPGKVVAFLDFGGNWDPSLAFVMVGAIVVYSTLHRWVLNMKTPVLGQAFSLPTKTDLDPKLIGGAALFGMGWGLGGFCPGPALASIGSGSTNVLLFIAAMFAGMYGFNAWQKAVQRRAERTTDG